MSNGYITSFFSYDPIDTDSGPQIFVDFTLEDFAVGSAAPMPFHIVFMASYAAALGAIPGGTIGVIGMASNTGGAAFNQALSQHRADNIRDQLIGFGLSKDKLTNDIALGAIGKAGVEDYQERGVSVNLMCPPSSQAALQALETRWNSDPLKQLAHDPLDTPTAA